MNTLATNCACLEPCPCGGGPLVLADDGTGTARVTCCSCEYSDTWTVTEPAPACRSEAAWRLFRPLTRSELHQLAHLIAVAAADAAAQAEYGTAADLDAVWSDLDCAWQHTILPGTDRNRPGVRIQVSDRWLW